VPEAIHHSDLDEELEQRLSALARMVGNTPLLGIRYRFRGRLRTLYAKCEQMNLTGSIKDRMALFGGCARTAMGPGVFRSGAVGFVVSRLRARKKARRRGTELSLAMKKGLSGLVVSTEVSWLMKKGRSGFVVSTEVSGPSRSDDEVRGFPVTVVCWGCDSARPGNHGYGMITSIR
jgi:hypothetical protein